MKDSIYDFTCTDINGQPVNLADFKDHIMLIVNTAGFCGFTPQYRGLEDIYRSYKDEKVVVLGFPSNQFGEEPHDNENINNFCVINYGVTFPMFSKVDINGDNAEPLFDYLKQHKAGLFGAEKISWNFTKFLINRDGEVISRFSPLTFPSKIRGHIDAIL